MSLKNRRFILALFLALGIVLVRSQTLYWVGGTGNFNDPNNWSRKSGGPAAGIVPGPMSDLVFDSGDDFAAANVFIESTAEVHSVRVTSYRKFKLYMPKTGVRLIVNQNFDNLLDNKNFVIDGTLEFRARTATNEGYASLGYFNHPTNVFITSGKWSVGNILLERQNKLVINGASVKFNGSFVQAGMLEFANAPFLEFNASVLKIRDEITVSNCNKYKLSSSVIGEKLYDKAFDSKLGLSQIAAKLGGSQITGKLGNNNTINAVCWSASLAAAPSCFPGCDGKVVITLPPLNCWTTPATSNYDVLINSPLGCSAVVGLTNVGPGTYTINGFCSCLTSYQILVQDGSGFLFDSNGISILSIPVVATPITPIASSSGSVSCFGSCNGSVSATFFGGTAPYSFTVAAPSATPSFTTSGGTVSRTGLCAGVVTISAADANSCSVTYTRTIATPSVLNINTATLNPICNGSCTGVFSVAPTGGSPNYTVVFSSGSTQSVAAGGTVSVGSLCAGAISATVTDTRGCTASVTRTITQPTAFTVTPTQTNITCAGLCSGGASVAMSGGGGTYTYTWSPTGGSAAGASSLCAGNYTVTVRDNLTCQTTRTYTVTQPTSITLVPTSTNIACPGLCTGIASVAASGPTSAISFTWVAPGGSVTSLSSNATNLCAGIYTVIAKDAPSSPTCVVTRTVNITQPNAFTVTPTTQSISCATATCSGNATITASGGNGAPYTYTWTPGATTSSVRTSLCAGNYTVAVRDASNCSTSTTLSILQPPTFTASISNGSVACSGACTGSINSTPSGGVAPYTFTLITPTSTITTAPPYTNLCAGNYTLLIRDSSPATCAQVFTTSVQQAPTLVPSISTTSITCFNACNGSLGGSAVGGTPSYTFTWNTPTGTVSGGALAGRCAGNYTLFVRDANNCTVSATSTLTQPTDMTVSVVPTNVTCFSSCNGALSGNAIGGTPGYTLTWSNGFTGNPNTSLCTGNYILTVTDTRGCVKTQTASVGTPSAIVLGTTTASTSCAGGCDGSATITASGGTPSFTFSFNSAPAITNTTGIATGLCAGNYIASVTDANGCPQSTAFTISSPPLLSAAITGIRPSCTGCTGSSTVTASNGSPGYTYSWTNSLTTVVSTASTAASLCPGNYTATVFDSKGCSANATVNIAQTVISAAVLGGTGIQCFGACTGSAVVSPSGGTAPYNFTWTPTAQTTQTATNLCAGVYTVTVRESGGSNCSSTATINIASPSSITVSSSQNSLSCFGVCTGSISASASGGTGAKTFSWSPGGQSTSSITNQCAGTYTLRITDANGCTVTPQTFTITQPTSVTATFTNTIPSGCTLSNGSICVTPSGGSGSGYTYSWSPVTGSNSCLTGLAAGVYSVLITDGTGCTRTLSSVLNSPAGPTITVAQQSVSCFGATTGGATITALGTPVFNYTWSPAVAGNTNVASGLGTGTYVVSVRDGNNCVTNQSVVIAQAASLTINSNTFNPRCAGGAPNGSITIAPSGATPPYNYAWSGPAFTATTQNVSGLGQGIYSLTLTDALLCQRNFTFNLVSPPPITVTAFSTRTVICSGVTNGSISVTASGGTSPITSFTWFPVGAFTGSTTATVLNLGPGIYSVSAIDANTCVSAPATWTLSPSTLTSAIVQQSATCSNSCNASATLNVTGGAPTYTFSWSSGGFTTSTASNLCVGNYTASVTDADGCVSQNGFTVSPASLFGISPTASQPLCNSTCNGSIAITPTGAVGTVNYVWSPAGSGQNAVGLCAGIYTVTAIDGNSCSATSVITLTNPPALLSNVTFTNPLCNNNCNGRAVINPTNAVGAVSVTWQPGGLTTNTISSLCATTYTAFIQDGNGCQDTQTFTLNNPTALNINTSIGPATCGSPNGSITLIPSGGTPGYSYTWSPNVSNTVSASGLAAQIYTVVVADQANCSNTITIPLSNSNGPTAPISFTNVACFGQTNGAISVGTLSGGTPPYQPAVWILPPPNATVNTLSNVGAGNYTVQLADNAGCITFTGATITQPSSVSVLPNVSLPTCNGICNGSITVNASGGVPGYSYSWTPAAPNTSVVTSLCAGNYTVVISHNSGLCSDTHTFDIPGQTNLTFTDNIVNNTCFGNCNGAASVSVIPTPGIPSPFAFSWSNGQTGNGPFSTSVSNLCNGAYSVIATGANGCFNVYTVNISSPSQLTVASTVSQPSCNVCNGAATVSPGGGAGGTYSIVWAAGATTSTLNNLCAGVYPLTIQDNLGCSQTATVIVDNSSGITGHTVTTSDIPCGATCTGAATVVASGTNLPISYNWFNPPAATSSVVSNLCAGTYFLQMQDAQGCIRNASLTINAATSITLSPFVSPPACGLTNGTINVLAAGGTPTYNFNWFPSAPNSGTLTNVGPGSYTLTVSDSSPGGCSTQSVINISNIFSPTVAISHTNINCYNACTGVAFANVTGTATPFTYNWGGGGNTPLISNLCKGALTLTVTDVNGCVSVASASISDNPEIQINIPALSQPSCNLCNGQAVVNAFGGSGPYTYSWTTGASTPSVSSLCAGLYQVIIRDNLNCQKTQNIVINNSNGITSHSFATQDVTCGNSCNGGATVTPVGGTLPISFNWITPPLSVTGNAATNLCAGVYFVQMQDAQGCLRTASANINPATSIVLTPLVIPPSCGLNNGVINVSATGGTPTYTFTWLPSGPNSGSVTGVGPGSYTLTVTDSSPGGCPTSTAINISNTNAPGVTLTATNVNCFSACTGAIQANVTGTATPFTYNWSGGGNSPSLTNICAGVITLTVTDTNSCVAVKSETITENPQLQAGIPQITQPTCNQCNGQVNISAIGGVAPYTYSWTSGAVGASLIDLCAGLYQVLITDNLNCQQTQNVIINNSNGITSHSFVTQDVACSNSCNGGATVTPQGGAPPISFNWINPVLNSTLSAVNNLCPGTYFVQMTDAFGCQRTGSTNINAGTTMSVTSNIVAPGCGQTNGIISVNVNGGTAPYTYSWSPVSANTPSVTGLGPGNYTVVVTDLNGAGCTETVSFNLSNLNGPSLTYTQTDVTCFGLCNGSVTAISTGTSATTFSWSTGSNSASSGSVCAGIITLTASANGCSTLRTFTIEQNPELEFNYSLRRISCSYNCDGQIAILPLGGLLSYSFNGTQSGSDNKTPANLCKGNYTLSVTDANGCSADSVVNLNLPIPITASLNTINSSCSSVADGAATASVSGGTPGYRYLWRGPSSYTANSLSIGNIFSGNYTLSVTDTLGCLKDTVMRVITTITIEAVAGPDTVMCPGGNFTLSAANSLGAVTYSWSQIFPNGNTVPVSSGSTHVITNAVDGTIYKYDLLTISATPGCFDRDTVVVTTYSIPYLDAGPSFTIPVFSTVTIGGNPTTSGIGTVTWSPSFSLSDMNQENPIASNTVAITYTASLGYGRGCLVSDTMRVVLYPEIRINNGFSPNNDGKNDRWIIDYLEQFPDAEVEVFNRWGDRLFYSRGYATPFDGTFKGKDLPVGTYYYIIRLNHPAYPAPYTGPLTIFR